MPVPRRLVLLVVALAAVVLIATPVLGASPSAKPEKAQRAERGPEIAKTLNGTITIAKDEKGRATFTMTVDGAAWELSAGPKWFWGDNNPLAAFVGKTVEVTGTTHAGDTEVDVTTVDGHAIRAAGKPPWAGGPKVIGKVHPGWKNGKTGRGHGKHGASGQRKDKTHAGKDHGPDADDATEHEAETPD